MSDGPGLFEATLAWLRDSYDERPFYLELDIVYAVQVKLWELVREHSLDWQVFNDYPMLPGSRRALSADIALRDGAGRILVAAEFKFEPDHGRPDLLSHKFPVVGFESALKDVQRIRQFVEAGSAEVAYAVFVDEGTFFWRREVETGSQWVEWPTATPEGRQTSVLWSRWPW